MFRNRSKVCRTLWRCLGLLLFLDLSTVCFLAQEPEEVVRVKSHLVSIDVMVKDKKGEYISNLKAEDFEVNEDGTIQTIQAFDPPVSTSKTPSTQVTKETQVSETRNIIALVIDGQTTDVTNLKRVREGTMKYVREQISGNDLVALFSVANGLQLLQNFTLDKTQILNSLQTFTRASGSAANFEQKDIAANIDSSREQAAGPNTPPPSSITTAAAGSGAARQMIAARVLQQFILLRTALSLQQSRPILASIAAICEGLRNLPGKKTLVLFSQGFVTPAVLDWQVRSTIDLANRANVALYIIDSAGLRASAPASGSFVPASPLSGVSAITNQEQRIQAVGGENVFDTVRQEGQNREYDILYRMSQDTGGRFIKGTNDIAKGLERVDREIRARYTLVYSSTNQNFDGSFRKVKIKVRSPEAEVIARSGYYAVPMEDFVPLSPEEKRLLESIAKAEAEPGIPIAVELTPFRGAEGLYTIPVAIELQPKAIAFTQKGDKRGMQLDVLGVIRGAGDRIISRLGGYFDVSLKEEQYRSIVSNNIFYRQDLHLASGEYTLDLIVRDRQSGKRTAKREKLQLPELNSEFATSAVVLSRHAEATKQSQNAAPDVFVHKNAKIRPFPTRQFSATDNLIIFLTVYNAANSSETGNPLVRVTVRLLKEGNAATRPFDYMLTDWVSEPVPHLTLAEYIGLSGLSPGHYTAAIEAKDMVTRKLVKQDATFSIMP